MTALLAGRAAQASHHAHVRRARCRRRRSPRCSSPVLTSLTAEPTENSVLIDVFNSDTIEPLHPHPRDRRNHRRVAPPDDHELAARRARSAAVPRRQDARFRGGRGRPLAADLRRRLDHWLRRRSPARDLPVPDAGELPSHCSAATRSSRLCLAPLGVGIGGVVRNQPAAIVGVLLLSFVLEPAVLRARARGRPLRPLRRLAARRPGHLGERHRFRASSTYSHPALAVLGMLAWIGAFFAAAAVLLRSRDIE